MSEIYMQNHGYMKSYCKVLFKDSAAKCFVSDCDSRRVEVEGQEMTAKKI